MELAKEQDLKDEIQVLKENLDRKEYLLQFNETKYYQYEKVLRSLILDASTPDEVKDQLRDKIESQELFVPKDERKVTNLVHQSQEKDDTIKFYREENQKLQQRVEELGERLRQGGLDGLADQTMEQLSIFQNKEMVHYRNVNVQPMVDNAMNADGSDPRSPAADKKTILQLTKTVDNLNNKLSKLKQEMQKKKEENHRLQDSVDNQMYINDKLNKALTKLMDRKKQGKSGVKPASASKDSLQDSLPAAHQENGPGLDHMDEEEVLGTTGGSNIAKEPLQEKNQASQDSLEFQPDKEKDGFAGDISSIMINPMERDAMAGGDFLEESVQFNKMV
jgi:hypothetical protein